MSAFQIVERLLKQAPGVADNIGIGMIEQPVEPPFIILTGISESQHSLINSAVDHFETRVSVEIITRNAIDCDRQAEAVKACLSYVVHQRVGSGTTSWEDVCCFKTGSDVFDYDDARTVYRRIIDYMVQWKPR